MDRRNPVHVFLFVVASCLFFLAVLHLTGCGGIVDSKCVPTPEENCREPMKEDPDPYAICDVAQANIDALGCAWGHPSPNKTWSTWCRDKAAAGDRYYIDAAPCYAEMKDCHKGITECSEYRPGPVVP